MFKDWVAHHTLLLIAILVVGGWLFLHEWRGKAGDLKSMQDFIQQKQADFDKQTDANRQIQDGLQKQLAAIAAQKQQIITVPSSAPQIIHDTIPLSTPIQQTAPITKDTKSTDVVGQLTLQQTQDLATFGLSCKECNDKLTALQQTDANKDQQIKDLTAQRDNAIKTAKGGSVWKRFERWAVPVGCAAGGALLGSKAATGSKAPAIGAVTAGTLCAIKF